MNIFNHHVIAKCTAAALLGMLVSSTARADGAGFLTSICAGRVVPINELPGAGVLYKPENVHGGRGPSFLVQNVAERTNKQVIEIRDAKCDVIGTLGLFKTDQPFGSRYYSKTGGSGLEDSDLLRLASAAGSTNILIEGVGGKWIRVRNPTERDGSVRK